MTDPSASAGCDRCERTPGFVAVEEDGVERLQPCVCRRKRLAAAANLPVEFRDARLSNWRKTPESATALKAATIFLRTDAPLDLFLCGSVGTGKTRLACTVLNEWIQPERMGLFVSVPELLFELQPHTDLDHTELYRRCKSAPLLVLDDIGAERERATDYTRRTVLMLYESRHNRGLPTIWTSNKTPAEIGEFMQDNRLMSRLVGWCEVIAMNGADWRLRRR